MDDKKRFITFDPDTGQVLNCTNEKNNQFPQIEISMEMMREFIRGEKRMRDFMVIPTPGKESNWELTSKHKDFNDFDVEKSIHQLTQVSKVENPDSFIYRQDLKNGKWYVKLTGQIKSMITSSPYYKDKVHTAYVTAKDDPNILLDTLAVEMYNMFGTEYEIPNCNSKVAKNPNVSLYCGKVFENYFHLVEKK